MSKQIYVNLPVSDLKKSTGFYEALGFTKNAMFSDSNASSMMWSNNIVVMLLKHDFYKKFIGEKEVADTARTSGVLLALSLDSKEDVQKFADVAKENGGDYYRVDMGIDSGMMFSYEVEDPDGHTWEPMWMNADFVA
ncbi:TPA: glyoxalase [Candidatus Saccharibacteria bacterium]|nr:MAG: Glyoxalase family protein [Candidatus Saccharibacteria bacterium GW2011_GWC2_44_17]OGL33731.1 MAG: glyoxalase [Candidatus Saccharibacteria bacterium RIFCSPHIGHO2_12_FULL_47_16]HBH77903.1 glyoxalase [Candidatus Saccharibacteria bacterium]